VNIIINDVKSDSQAAKFKCLEYFGGFDYLRVFFAASIVAWHVKLFGCQSFQDALIKPGLPDIIYTIYALLSSLFFQVAIFYTSISSQTKLLY
jgi:hypothetical protein